MWMSLWIMMIGKKTNPKEISAFFNFKNWHSHSPYIINTPERMHESKIKIRIGGINKIQYWLYWQQACAFSRQKSRLSEAQINIRLPSASKHQELPQRNEVYTITGFPKLRSWIRWKRIAGSWKKFNLAIHPLQIKMQKEQLSIILSPANKLADPAIASKLL